MPFTDLREWISALEQAGELQRVQVEVDWNLEAGAIVRRMFEVGGPAALFEKIKDYPSSFRILGGPMAQGRRGRYARVAVALDLPSDSTVREITESYLRRRKTLIPPVRVPS